MKQGKKMEICQVTVILAVAVALVIVSALLIGKFHIMSLSDTSVVIGVIACYVFAVCAIVFDVWYIRKHIRNRRMEKWDNESHMHGKSITV
ncbi:MAG: hypothetical protein LIO80_05210 [Lachnospiraceae bacterium]|nr:hypothetical protein [Lachnospiraceae bacterium]